MAKLRPNPPGVRLDVAIERTLSAANVDGVTRVHFDRMRRVASNPERAPMAGVFEGASLSDALMSFVMPSLQNPDVLQAERHRMLLENLAQSLAGTSGKVGEGKIAREGALVIRRELRRLVQLRQNCNSLVKG